MQVAIVSTDEEILLGVRAIGWSSLGQGFYLCWSIVQIDGACTYELLIYIEVQPKECLARMVGLCFRFGLQGLLLWLHPMVERLLYHDAALLCY